MNKYIGSKMLLKNLFISSGAKWSFLSFAHWIWINSVIFKFDHDQISRVCFNLIKNSIESLKEKSKKTSNFVKNIDIEIVEHIDYISLTIIDSGIGFKNIKTSELTKPYFTTKADGTGLGLSIVSKIINDHNGMITFTNLSDGAKVEIKFSK